jgi:DNA topoisomerase-1
MRLIVKALAPQAEKVGKGRAYYYHFENDEGKFFVCSCLGHLFETDFKPELTIRWRYPVVVDPHELIFNPRSESKPFINLVKKLSNSISRLIVATDNDREGSFIALECIEQILGWNPQSSRIRRMVFNSLTKRELTSSFRNLVPFDHERALAGKLRAWMDLLWGANLTRALTLAARRYKRVRVLSAGRVQTPVLRLIYERCKEREEFVPRPYWEVWVSFETAKGEELKAVLIDSFPEDPKNPSRIFDEEVATAIMEVVKDIGGGIAHVKSELVEEAPPIPYSISILQKEAQSHFGFSPHYTKKLTQSLYESGLVSYPRSGSEKFDTRPGKHDRRYFESLLKALSPYNVDLSKYVLQTTNFMPRQGRKFDGAHPPIHAVSVPKKALKRDMERLYDLIWKRTLALFAPKCRKESLKVDIYVGSHRFTAKGMTLIDKGWRKVFDYAKVEEVTLPEVKSGEEMRIVNAWTLKSETKPPPPYSPAVVIRIMEKLGIGTPATRDEELRILYKRKYVYGRRVVLISNLGKTVVEALKELIEQVTSPNMTAEMEAALDKIERGQLSVESFVRELKKKVNATMANIKKIEDELGSRLAQALP